jgi:ATP-dependent Clp protease ATP-binding subunit ClpA
LASLGGGERDRLEGLEAALGKIILGQEAAVAAVADTLRQVRLGLREDNRPQAVLLFAGPTGVGKTALAECLAREFFGLPEALIRIDGSEYMDKHSVSRLIGAPPGYVGHDEQGQLTKALRSRPFSLVLIDEIDKADPQVSDVFLQLFGSGRLTDGRGDVVDARQAIFVMTTNLGCEAHEDEGHFGFQSPSEDEDAVRQDQERAIREACQEFFRPELINRIDRIIVFRPLKPRVLREILNGLIAELSDNLTSRGVVLEVPDEVRDVLVRRAGTTQGVPPLKRLLHDQILKRVGELMLSGPANETLQVAAMVEDGEIELRVV